MEFLVTLICAGKFVIAERKLKLNIVPKVELFYPIFIKHVANKIFCLFALFVSGLTIILRKLLEFSYIFTQIQCSVRVWSLT